MKLLNKQEAVKFIRDHADVLNARTNEVNPFARSEWMQLFVEQVVQDDWSLVVPQSDRGDSVMLLYHECNAPTRCTSLANYYSSLFSPVRSSRGDSVEFDSLVRQLTALRPQLSTVNFSPLNAESVDTLALEKALVDQRWYVRRYFCFANWYLPCEGVTFHAYMSGRDSQLRNTIGRKSKKFDALGHLEIFTTGEHVESAMDAYDAIYSKSWKHAEPYPHFVREWARVCAREGWLRLGIAWLDGIPIAAQFWFTIDRRAYIFKLAYDEEHAKWSAGTLLSAHMFQHALDADKVVEIDYLTGDDAYKKAWVTHRRERIGLMACNLRSPRGLAAAAIEYAGKTRARLRGVWQRMKLSGA